MRSITALTLILLLLTPIFPAFGLDFEYIETDHPEIDVITSSAEGFTININFPPAVMEKEYTEGGIFDHVRIPGCGSTSEIGRPELPSFTRLLRLPRSKIAALKVFPGEAEIIPGIELNPVQPLARENLSEDRQFIQDIETYSQNRNYPSDLSELGDIIIWRELKIVPLNLFPLQYNPVKKELTVYRSITVEITYREDDNPGEFTQPPFITESFAPLYQDYTIGSGDQTLDMPVQRGAYLIIATPSFYSGIQSLAEWKRRMGYYTYVASTNETGTSSSLIRAFIANAYHTWEIPPEYVLLVGDTNNGMPTFYVQGYSYQCCTDLPYVLIEGNDYFPEAHIGRFPVESSTQLSTIINKIMHYEKEPFVSQTAWYPSALLIADYSGAESVKYTKEFTGDQLQIGGYTNLTDAFYPGSSTSLISQTINNGVSFVNYRGYGGHTYWTMNMWNNWTVNNVYSLNNGYKLPVVTSMVCGGGRFDYSSECLGEAFLRQGTPTMGKAAVAFCGPSELHTHTKWNNNLDCGLYWGIFRENINHFGPALLRSKLELWIDYPHNREGIGGPTNSVGFYFHVYNILGDPGLRMWTGIPQPIDADYSDQIALGMNQFEITLSDNMSNPIPDAYVCIEKGAEIYEGGFTDENGFISLPLQNYTSGAMTLTVTGKNLIPLLDDIALGQQPITLGISNLEIIDDNSGGTSGNGDGMISPAETVDLILTVKNYGSSVTGVSIVGALTSTSDKVEVVAGTGSFGTLAPGAESTAVLTITLSSDLTILDNLDLNLELTCSQGNWNQTVWADISDAEFIPLDYEYLPATLEPGGEANFVVMLKNDGLCDATSVTAELVSLDPLIDVLASTSEWGNILSGTTASNSAAPFRLAASQDVFPGRLAHLQLLFETAEGYTPTSDIIITVGTVTQADPMGPDAYGYYCFDSYDIEYEKHPAYAWVTFTGTQLSLPDLGDEQDCRVSVDLPFTFRYYGEDFDLISVCSNGFIAMGYSDIVQFRNKAIPSAMGPPAMIAGFWDDLKMVSGGAVYKYEDAANHRFIIEYRNVKNDYSNVNERFQIILYDPAYYPTPTGDGEIVIQFYDVNDWDADDNYSTVGITDWNHTTGIEYAFSNIYTPSSSPLIDGLAIKFTTDPGVTQPPELGLTFEPVNPPIVIPAIGGNFQYSVTVENLGNSAAAFDFWTEADIPGGTTISPILLRTGINLLPGASVSRTMLQQVPANAPPGEYTFRGILGVHPDEVYESQDFQFEKESNEVTSGKIQNGN